MPSKPVVRVLDKLDGVAEISAGWTALCPAHDDNFNSLSIAEGRDGRVLLFCHAGCTLSEIVDALGISVASLFTRRMEGK